MKRKRFLILSGLLCLFLGFLGMVISDFLETRIVEDIYVCTNCGRIQLIKGDKKGV